MEKIFEKLNPYMTRLANNPTLKGISSGMMGSIVVTLVGSLCLLLVVFPVEAVRNAVEALGITSILLNVNSFTIALYIVVMVTNALVKSYNSQEDGIAAAVVGLMSFLIVTPIGATADKISAIPTTWLGAAGVFSAMIISIIIAVFSQIFRVFFSRELFHMSIKGYLRNVISLISKVTVLSFLIPITESFLLSPGLLRLIIIIITSIITCILSIYFVGITQIEQKMIQSVLLKKIKSQFSPK